VTLIDRPVGLRFIGDTGLANMTRVCGWLSHGLLEHTPHGSYNTIRTGDAGIVNVHAVGRGEVDVAVVTPSAVATLGFRGAGPFAAQAYPHLRAIGELPHRDSLLFALRAELGVASFAELRSHRPALRLATTIDQPGAAFAGYAVARLLEAAGLSRDTLRRWGGELLIRHAPNACLAALAEGEADAVLHEAVMMPWWSDLAANHRLTYLSFEPDVLRFAQEDLACPPATLPTGYLPGLDSGVETVDFRGFLVVVREDLPDDVAYALSWTLGETCGPFIAMNYGHIQARHSPISYPVERRALAHTPIPLHRGAARYYSE
jgi:uncharacterized protein